MSRTYRYNLVDVFSERRFAGNPLAVFVQAKGLSSQAMQTIAQELGRSETVFVLPPESGGHARLRIFTPRVELPFAGHPVLGAAWVLGTHLVIPHLRLETQAGVIEVELERSGDVLFRGFVTQPRPSIVPLEVEPAVVRRWLGLPSTTSSAVVVVDNGPRHFLIEVADPATLVALEAPSQALDLGGGVLVYCLSHEIVRVRYFAPSLGIPEDPATGSAAGALGFWLFQNGLLESGRLLKVSQGVELGRPSELFVLVEGEGRNVQRVLVGGAAVLVGRGELIVDGVS